MQGLRRRGTSGRSFRPSSSCASLRPRRVPSRLVASSGFPVLGAAGWRRSHKLLVLLCPLGLSLGVATATAGSRLASGSERREASEGAGSMTQPIVFLSDFGYRNEWVGSCHAVMDKVAPGVRVVDLSHGVPPLDVRAGALELADSLPYIRHESVVLAVVDPSVGRDRDLAIRTGDGRLFVGPDNGLLAPAWHMC